MDFLPINLDVKGRPCLVVGGGKVALRKVRLLHKCGAFITVCAPDLDAEIVTLAAMPEESRIKLLKEEYSSAILDDQMLVIAATNDELLNVSIAEQAKAKKILVNVADNLGASNFILPSILDRSPLLIAISSGGATPTLARLLRAQLEVFIPKSTSRLAQFLGRYRERVHQKLQNKSQRRRLWEKIIEGPIAELIRAGRDEEAETAIDEVVAACNKGENDDGGDGEVYLVGAGPGDPDLLTLRALQLMQKADVVFYDRLVSDDVLDLVRRDAERIYVGKKRSFHSVRQQEINQLLVEYAQQGKRVLRLKGGDPFIFGRGGEEIESLAEHHIPFQIVPGITAASGCSSYAGIPLTHRDYAQSVIFVTGHQADESSEMDWRALVRPRQTVVIYMGLVNLDEICNGLMAHGMDRDMPVALIEKGTHAQQNVMISTVQHLAEKVSAEQPRAPTLIIIGEVVRLQKKLQWFHSNAVKP